MIHDSLRELAVPIDSIKEHPNNARHHNQDSVDALALSLSRFTQRTPLVVDRGSGLVLAGNGRLRAAKQLGWSEVAVVMVDDDETIGTAYALADNRTAELSHWDDDALNEAIMRLSKEDLELTRGLGWSTEELDELIVAATLPEREQEPEEFVTVTFNSDQWSSVQEAIDLKQKILVGNEPSKNEIIASLCAEWVVFSKMR